MAACLRSKETLQKSLHFKKPHHAPSRKHAANLLNQTNELSTQRWGVVVKRLDKAAAKPQKASPPLFLSITEVIMTRLWNQGLFAKKINAKENNHPQTGSKPSTATDVALTSDTAPVDETAQRGRHGPQTEREKFLYMQAKPNTHDPDSISVDRSANQGEFPKPKDNKLNWRNQVNIVKKAFFNYTDNPEKQPVFDPCRADYCYARANVIAKLVHDSQSANFVGWINAKFTPKLIISKTLNLGYHIAALVHEQGKLYIADPLLDEPILLDDTHAFEKWIEKCSGQSPHKGQCSVVHIPPTEKNYPGMPTNNFPELTSERLSQLQKTPPEHHQVRLQKEEKIVSQALGLTLWRDGVVRKKLITSFDLRTFWEARKVHVQKLDRNFLFENDFSSPNKSEPTKSGKDVEITPEIKEVFNLLNIPHSERLEI